ncbi:MAG: hypothetical protein DELT_00311 [Desulfovibrio sp.]
MKAELIGLLQKMRFSEYEAKAYLALLEKAPLSGYAVALQSGVPRSKIYEVLGTLVSRGDVIISHDETPRYSPLPPEELLERHKRQAETVFNEAGPALQRYATAPQLHEGIWNISGHDAIIARVREGVSRATQRVLLEVWPEEAAELRGDLQNAATRGVDVVVIAYGELELGFGRVFRSKRSEEVSEAYGGRWIVFSADNREVVTGICSLGAQSRAAWTSHPCLVMPITEFILHDLYLMEIIDKLGPELAKTFGADLAGLHGKFLLPELGKKYYPV